MIKYSFEAYLQPFYILKCSFASFFVHFVAWAWKKEEEIWFQGPKEDGDLAWVWIRGQCQISLGVCLHMSLPRHEK